MSICAVTCAGAGGERERGRWVESHPNPPHLEGKSRLIPTLTLILTLTLTLTLTSKTNPGPPAA